MGIRAPQRPGSRLRGPVARAGRGGRRPGCPARRSVPIRVRPRTSFWLQRGRCRGTSAGDRILGTNRADTIRAVGGGRDIIDCGPGRDHVEKDSKHRVRNCEVVL